MSTLPEVSKGPARCNWTSGDRLIVAAGDGSLSLRKRDGQPIWRKKLSSEVVQLVTAPQSHRAVIDSSQQPHRQEDAVLLLLKGGVLAYQPLGRGDNSASPPTSKETKAVDVKQHGNTTSLAWLHDRVYCGTSEG